jgi:hypothetical protein
VRFALRLANYHHKTKSAGVNPMNAKRQSAIEYGKQLTASLDGIFSRQMHAAESRVVQALETQFTYESLSARFGVTVDTIYCSKTGQPIGTRDHAQLRILQKMYGTEDAAALFEQMEYAGCAAHWLRTDSAALDLLMEHDPRGYFVYAMSLCMQPFYGGYNSLKHVWEDVNMQRWFQFHKTVLYAATEDWDLASIAEANEALRTFLTIVNPRNVKMALRWAGNATLASIAHETDLTVIVTELKRIAKEYVRRQGIVRNANTQYDVVRMVENNQYARSVAGQRKPKILSEVDHLAIMLKEFGIVEDNPRANAAAIAKEEPKKNTKYETKLSSFDPMALTRQTNVTQTAEITDDFGIFPAEKSENSSRTLLGLFAAAIRK